MKVLVVGSGGREHALVWKLARSGGVKKLWAAPGNPGMKPDAELVPIAVSDIAGIVAFSERERIDLAVVGPEAPLAEGLTDRLRERGILCFGPGAQGARLESSKKYARDFMARHGIPSPSYRVFSRLEEAREYIGTLKEGPVVVKADGLAQGKGVVVAQSRAEACAAVEGMIGAPSRKGNFGKAGEEVLIEECLAGEEVSLLTFTDGRQILPMLPVQDHKRIGEGDTGPNTGGMGTYAPVSTYTPQVAAQVEETILRPLQKALLTENIDYRGCLYVGLMLTDGGPKVIEFNCRFGDPEAQVLMPLLKSDLFEILYACAKGELEERKIKIEWSAESAVCVVMASRGYPGSYEVGHVIEEGTGAPLPEDVRENSWVFHAGTKEDGEGGKRILTAGGRVLGVTARGITLGDALRRAYTRVDGTHFEGRVFRRDIAHRELARLKENPAEGIF